MNPFPGTLSLTCSVLFFALAASQLAPAQTAPDQTPQPGQLGSPFPTEHAWNHLGLEVGGGYAPVLQKGAGYFNHGFNVTTGVVDHFNSGLSAMLEAQIFGLRGNLTEDDGAGNATFNNSNVVVSVGLAASYNLLRRSATSPYLIGGAGYYYVGPMTQTALGGSNLTAVNSVNAAGFNAGAGVRHRLYADRTMEVFAEARYHYIASGSTAFGQLSLLPMTAGIRW